jgi:hypothetical protein
LCGPDLLGLRQSNLGEQLLAHAFAPALLPTFAPALLPTLALALLRILTPAFALIPAPARAPAPAPEGADTLKRRSVVIASLGQSVVEIIDPYGLGTHRRPYRKPSRLLLRIVAIRRRRAGGAEQAAGVSAPRRFIA